MRKHPAETELALLAHGDLSLLQAWSLRRHVSRCPECQAELDGFRAAHQHLGSGADELPAGLRWDRLAEEMTANIRLGLEAGECVAAVPPRAVPAPRWRAAAVVATVSALLFGAWALNPIVGRKPVAELHAVQRAEIRNTSTGLEVNENGSALVMLHGRNAAQKPIVVSTPGSLRARFVDDDTGQITITHVYAE